MFTKDGLFATYFVISILAIIFLGFQVNQNFNECLASHITDQEHVTQAARLILKSATSGHALFKYDHALEAKFILDGVIARNGSIVMAEKNLGAPKGSLDSLRSKIVQQTDSAVEFLMTRIIEAEPHLDTELNAEAGLERRPVRRNLTRKQR